MSNTPTKAKATKAKPPSPARRKGKELSLKDKLSKFGLPAIFLTISPDDLRNYRIVVYALKQTEKAGETVDVKDLSDEQTRSTVKVHMPVPH
jgi:hypothetical protein